MIPQTAGVHEQLLEYEKILGVGKEYTPKKVLQCFLVSYEVQKENQEVDQLIEPTIEAKNKLMQHLVSIQMKAQRYFEIESPFDNSCVACRGTGEIYRFNRKTGTVSVNCHICGGKTKVKSQCPVCKGSGIFAEKWKGGEDIPCNKCRATGQVYVKCSECRGEGKLKKIVLDHTIKDTTPCKVCKQMGFTKNEKLKKPISVKKVKKASELINPVISQNLAEQIKCFLPVK